MHFVIVPGIGGSDREHWQSNWQSEWGTAASRIEPESWVVPDLGDWVHAIDRCIAESRSRQVVLVAHSLGCLAVAEWCRRSQESRTAVVGAFLVAPPNSAGTEFPSAAKSFASARIELVGVPGLIVYSDDDPYCDADAGHRLAAGLRLDRISAGAVGHINSDSKLGSWDFGRALLGAFIAGLGSLCDGVLVDAAVDFDDQL